MPVVQPQHKIQALIAAAGKSRCLLHTQGVRGVHRRVCYVAARHVLHYLCVRGRAIERIAPALCVCLRARASRACMHACM